MKLSNRLGPRARALLLVALGAGVLTACFPIKFEARMPLPQPLIAKMPFAVALHVPSEFSSFSQKEKRWSVNWEVALGKAQAEGFTNLLNAMFERVVVVDSVDAATHGEPVRAILEPAIEEYAFVTPRDAGSSFFAVSIKYRMGIYTPEGKLADSWAFTGYGSAPTSGMSDEDSLQRATALALRDAAAKLAVEFRDQEIVRELLPSADAERSSAPAAKPDAEEGAAAPAPTPSSEPSAAPSSEPTSPVPTPEPSATPGSAPSAAPAEPAPPPAVPEAPVQATPKPSS
ncbi:MAG: hypothetical protein ABW034_25440 [Steroidobacteraceae bacterium]